MLWLISIGVVMILFAAIPLTVGWVAGWIYKKLSGQ
jgi:hypothetical protein